MCCRTRRSTSWIRPFAQRCPVPDLPPPNRETSMTKHRFSSWRRNLRCRNERTLRQAGSRLRLEGLESRDLLSTFVVNTLSDSLGVPGSLSLRDAITQANAAGGGNTITFAVTGTISLDNAAGALPTIRDDLIIQGPGAASLTVQRPSSAAAFRIFVIARAFTVTIADLTLSGGTEANQG